MCQPQAFPSYLRRGTLAVAILTLAACSSPTTPAVADAPPMSNGMISVGGGRSEPDTTVVVPTAQPASELPDLEGGPVH
jgi:hypothetical protein